MVTVRCESEDKLPLSALEPFQGKLKKRTDEDVERLASSIKDEGLLMPFAVWRGKNYLLDGHGRRLALLRLANVDPEIDAQEFPVIYVDAETEDEARKALLQITSSYGKVSGWGVKEFTKSIPTYKAPVLDKFVRRKAQRRPHGSINKAADEGWRDMRISVREDKANAVEKMFRECEYIRVEGYGK